MAEVTQFTFDLRELTTALIKQQGLHEGLWLIAFEFGMGAGIIGPTPEDARPTGFFQVVKVQLVKQTQIPVPHPQLTVNAAEVNPAPATRAT
jgi:hypothetical protein